METTKTDDKKKENPSKCVPQTLYKFITILNKNPLTADNHV